MIRIAFIAFFVAALAIGTVVTLAEEARETKSVTPQRKASLYRIPIDPQERAKALGQILENPAPGSGTFFMFNTRFTPSRTEQSSLRPGIILNQQQVSPPYTVQGYCMIYDPQGFRARIGGIEIRNNQTTQIESIFAGGNRIYHWSLVGDNQKPSEELSETKYMEFDGKGIEYFLNSVRYRGVISGPPMEKMLDETGARRIGVENIRGTRTLVYGIQPTKQDFIKELQYLQVWVRVGDFKIIRTNLEKTLGAELTEYSRHISGVKFDDENFLMPDETIDQFKKEYESFVNENQKGVVGPQVKPEEKSEEPAK